MFSTGLLSIIRSLVL